MCCENGTKLQCRTVIVIENFAIFFDGLFSGDYFSGDFFTTYRRHVMPASLWQHLAGIPCWLKFVIMVLPLSKLETACRVITVHLPCNFESARWGWYRLSTTRLCTASIEHNRLGTDRLCTRITVHHVVLTRYPWIQLCTNQATNRTPRRLCTTDWIRFNCTQIRLCTIHHLCTESIVHERLGTPFFEPVGTREFSTKLTVHHRLSTIQLHTSDTGHRGATSAGFL